MGYYIFKTESGAEAYNHRCVIAHGHHDSTSKWDIAMKHPTLNKWAITASKSVQSSVELVSNLPKDWVTKFL